MGLELVQAETDGERQKQAEADRNRQLQSDWHPCGQLCDVLSVPLANQVYRLPPLPPTLPALDELMGCWLQGVVDGFLSAFFCGCRPGIVDIFEAAGVTFWSILGSFWQAVAPCGHLPGPSGA